LIPTRADTKSLEHRDELRIWVLWVFIARQD